MTILTFAGHLARRLGNSRARTARRLRREIARYPESVRADLGWPAVVEHPGDQTAIKLHDIGEDAAEGPRPFRPA